MPTRKLYLKGKFEGWCTEEYDGYIYDVDNNRYELNEIRAIFFYRQLQRTMIGTKHDIMSLKQILQEKIQKVELPSVTIDCGELQEKFVHPHYRRK